MLAGDYIGDAPLVHSVSHYGAFGMIHRFTIEAQPKSEWGVGMFVQEREVSIYAIPKRVFFDMRLRPVYPAQPIDANVNVRGQN